MIYNEVRKLLEEGIKNKTVTEDNVISLVCDIINKHKSDLVEIKASGGIKSKKDMITLIEAGASRIGTSHGVKIMTGECNCNHGYCTCEEECQCGHCEEE